MGTSDVDALRVLLAEDATFSMPPWARSWCRGRETIAGLEGGRRSLRGGAQRSTRANGQPAIAYYHLDDETGRYKAAALGLTLDGSEIKDITAFVKPELFPRFGLPVELAP